MTKSKARVRLLQLDQSQVDVSRLERKVYKAALKEARRIIATIPQERIDRVLERLGPVADRRDR